MKTFDLIDGGVDELKGAMAAAMDLGALDFITKKVTKTGKPLERTGKDLAAKIAPRHRRGHWQLLRQAYRAGKWQAEISAQKGDK